MRHRVFRSLLALSLLTALPILPGPTLNAQERGTVSLGPPGFEPLPLCYNPCDLVINGNFEDGDTGFDSLPGVLGQGWDTHGVIVEAHQVIGSWKGSNHTPNGEFFLAVDSETSSGLVTAWSQKVSALSNVSYTFEAFVLNLYTPDTAPTVRLAIYDTFGALLSNGPWVEVKATAPNWHPLVHHWTAPWNQQTVELRIEFQQPNRGGHDLGIDDVSFNTCGGFVDAQFTLEVAPCSELPLAVEATFSASGSFHTWQIAQADAHGNPTSTWGFFGKGKKPDISWYPFEPGNCYVIRQRVRDACGNWYEATRSFCIPEIYAIPRDFASDEMCERICCDDGEEFFDDDRCGCGCRKNSPQCLPDLEIDKRLVSAEVGADGGQIWNFELQVTNVSDCPAPGPTAIDDLLPPGLEPVRTLGEDWSCPTPLSRELSCTYGRPLAAGDSTTLVVSVEVGEEAHTDLENCAEVASLGDWRPQNNRSCVLLPCHEPGECGVEIVSEDQRVCSRYAHDPPCEDGWVWFWGACGCSCKELKIVEPGGTGNQSTRRLQGGS